MQIYNRRSYCKLPFIFALVNSGGLLVTSEAAPRSDDRRDFGALYRSASDTLGEFTRLAVLATRQPASGTNVDEAKALAFVRGLDPWRRNAGVIASVQDVLSLDLCRLEIGDQDTVDLAHFVNLASLDLSFTRVGDLGLRRIEHLKDIDALNLAGTKITGVGLTSVSKLRHLRSLRLDLTDVAGGLAHLKELRTLEYLYLYGANVDERDLTQLGKLPRLRDVDVGRIGTSHLFLEAFRMPKNLTKLSVRENEFIDNESCRHLLRFSNLCVLDVGQTSIRDEALSHLGKVETLRELDIGDTAVGDSGLASLSRLTKLTHLNLTSTRVSDLGIDKLRPLIHLQSLALCNIPLSDAACSTLRRLQSLRRIDIRGTRITEKGLIELCQSTSLRSVLMSASVASPKTISRLKAERRELEIEREEDPIGPEARNRTNARTTLQASD